MRRKAGGGKLKKLTLKQQKFADEYIISGNATQSAIKAGYSEKYANTNAVKLLQNTTIKAYLDERLSELNSKKIADQQEVLEFFTAAMRGELTEPMAIGLGDGVQQIIEVRPNIATRKSAAVELAKRYGLSTAKVDVNVKSENKLAGILLQLEDDKDE
ncbi:terminase small subunit [Gemella sanguinis]|uniref:terminase small subunit n=1 Tax=Gemella sanguinis TaxID=84135 RepID=UPI0028D29257|nr:terminase small subunit [Gemella sanguinis]